MERCANCERGIGNLEEGRTIQGLAVCADCYRKLVEVPRDTRQREMDRKRAITNMTIVRAGFFVFAVLTSFSGATLPIAIVLWIGWIALGVGGLMAQANNK